MIITDMRPQKRQDIALSEIRLKKATAKQSEAIKRLNHLLGDHMAEAAK